MGSTYTVLLVGSFAARALARDLTGFGFDVRSTDMPEMALIEFGRGDFDVVVTALPLPGMGTPAFCRALRSRGRTPILIAAPGEGWLEALNAGADDHVFVPCDPRELNARIEALVRRFRGSVEPLLTVQLGAARLYLRSWFVRVEPPLALSPVQVTLLAHFGRCAGRPVSTTTLDRLLVAEHGAAYRTRLDAEILDAELEVLAAMLAGVAGREVLVQGDDGGWCLSACD